MPARDRSLVGGHHEPIHCKGSVMFAAAVPVACTFTIFFNGSRIAARQGETVAACLLRAGVTAFRQTPVTGEPRMPYCMIGHCFDCLVEIEGQGSLQACLVPVKPGMTIRSQDGSASVFWDV